MHLVGKRPTATTGANPTEIKPKAICTDQPGAPTIAIFLIEELLATRSRAKIDKVTLDAVKLTAIFSKRRKIGAS